jgi:hypothetical protein
VNPVADRPSRRASRADWLVVHSHVLSVFDGARREWWAVSALALAFVVLRSAPWVFWEGTHFDSDQAVIGLMAKHLSGFRTFPVFFYGQNYMLGVQAWIIAPFFWLARPSVTVLRLPLLMLNAAAAVFLMHALRRELRLRPIVIFVAALPFIAATPGNAGNLLDGQGCGAGELYFYALGLWALRTRPLAFGALFMLGYLHREFTLLVLPALLITEAIAGTLWSRASLVRAFRAAAGGAIVWLIIDDLYLHLSNTSLLMQAKMMGMSTCFRPAELWQRILYLFTTCLPVLFGTSRLPLHALGARNITVIGSPLVGWIVFPALILMLVRLAYTWRKVRGRPDLALFLLLLGTFGLASYALACTTNTTDLPLLRYLHLALLAPIGCLAAFLVWEPSRRFRALALAVFVVWGAANVADSVRTLYNACVAPEPSPHRILANYLMERHIRYARAGYWDAYVLDFLTRERVIVASNEKVRVPEYQRLVDEHPTDLMWIERQPCQGQIQVASWCLSYNPAGTNR